MPLSKVYQTRAKVSMFDQASTRGSKSKAVKATGACAFGEVILSVPKWALDLPRLPQTGEQAPQLNNRSPSRRYPGENVCIF